MATVAACQPEMAGLSTRRSPSPIRRCRSPPPSQPRPAPAGARYCQLLRPSYAISVGNSPVIAASGLDLALWWPPRACISLAPSRFSLQCGRVSGCLDGGTSSGRSPVSQGGMFSGTMSSERPWRMAARRCNISENTLNWPDILQEKSKLDCDYLPITSNYFAYRPLNGIATIDRYPNIYL
jgi:hypothetical protein